MNSPHKGPVTWKFPYGDVITVVISWVLGFSVSYNYSNVIRAPCRLILPATRLFVHQLLQANNKENSQSPHRHVAMEIHRSPLYSTHDGKVRVIREPFSMSWCHHTKSEFQSHYLFMDIWGIWWQKQVSQAGISNRIPQNTVGCNYLSMPEVPAFDTKVLIYRPLEGTLMSWGRSEKL